MVFLLWGAPFLNPSILARAHHVRFSKILALPPVLQKNMIMSNHIFKKNMIFILLFQRIRKNRHLFDFIGFLEKKI